MTTITIRSYDSAASAIEQAEQLISALHTVAPAGAPAYLAEAVHMLSTAAREYLKQAAENYIHPVLAPRRQALHDMLRELNTRYYKGLNENDLRRLAVERWGFEHPENVGWDETRKAHALVFVLNDAYPYNIIEKARIQAAAYERAGKSQERQRVLDEAATGYVYA